MQPYKVKFVSQTNIAVLLIGGMAVFFGVAFWFNPHGTRGKSWAWSVTAISFGIVYFLWQRFATGRTEWTFGETEINIVWTKRFPFSRLSDLVIRWDNIEKIWRGPDPHYYCLRIRLISGKTFKFYHDPLTTGDDFQKCIETLYQTFAGKNNTRMPKPIDDH